MPHDNSVSEYDLDAVQVILFNIPISGFGEDDAVEYEEDEDGFTEVAGADGGFTLSKNLKVKGTLTITLMQSSKANAVLSAIYKADRLANGGAGVGPILIKDGNGTSFLASDTARIVKRPATKYSSKATPRVWKIAVYNGEQFEGGI